MAKVTSHNKSLIPSGNIERIGSNACDCSRPQTFSFCSTDQPLKLTGLTAGFALSAGAFGTSVNKSITCKLESYLFSYGPHFHWKRSRPNF